MMERNSKFPHIVLFISAALFIYMLFSCGRFIQGEDSKSISENRCEMKEYKSASWPNRKRFISPSGVDVDKVLHFIPENSFHNCRNLFTTSTALAIKPSQKYLQLRPKLNDIQGKKGYTPEDVKLTLVYQEMAHQASSFTSSPIVCEIGFNKGQSALAWLTARDDLKLVSFDIGLRKWTPAAVKFVTKYFADRFEYHEGDSKETVPEYAKVGPTCDILSIDGDHRFNTVYKDFMNMEKLAKKKHIMIADDVNSSGVQKAWNKLLHAGFAKEYYRCSIPNKDIDFLIGEYINRTITF